MQISKHQTIFRSFGFKHKMLYYLCLKQNQSAHQTHFKRQKILFSVKLLRNMKMLVLHQDAVYGHLHSRAVSYQLDYRDCPVSRGSSNPMLWQQVPQGFIIDVKFASGIKNIVFFLPFEVGQVVTMLASSFTDLLKTPLTCLLVRLYEQRSVILHLDYLICRR